MALGYVEWCHENGFDYNKVDHHEAWHRYMDAELREPAPTSTGRLSGRITRTWMQDREAELRRRSYQRHWQIIWPRQPLRIVSL
jgi:hypothetical protein